MNELGPESPPPPDEPWLAGVRSLAEAAGVGAKLPPGVVRGPLAKNFRVEHGPWRGWTVAAIYEKSDFATLAGFKTPKGVIMPLADWPACRDRTMLLEWRPRE